jgi:viroplasmin and RNaseH domain-containing protein
MIVQILQKDKLITQKFISHSGQLTYDYILPGKYRIKCIFDRNGNKKWDTGNYLKKLEPEKVKFWWKEEDVRSGFDVEVQISCKDSILQKY